MSVLDSVFQTLSLAQDVLGRDAVYRRADGSETTVRVAAERFWNGGLSGVYPASVDRALWSFAAESLGDERPKPGDELDVAFGDSIVRYVVVLNSDDGLCWTWRDKAARARIIVCCSERENVKV